MLNAKILGVDLLVGAIEPDPRERRVKPLAERVVLLADGDADFLVDIDRLADEAEIAALPRCGEPPHSQRIAEEEVAFAVDQGAVDIVLVAGAAGTITAAPPKLRRA